MGEPDGSPIECSKIRVHPKEDRGNAAAKAPKPLRYQGVGASERGVTIASTPSAGVPERIPGIRYRPGFRLASRRFLRLCFLYASCVPAPRRKVIVPSKILNLKTLGEFGETLDRCPTAGNSRAPSANAEAVSSNAERSGHAHEMPAQMAGEGLVDLGMDTVLEVS